MVIQVLGKSSFYSQNKKKDFFLLHVCYHDDNVEGFAVDQKFVSGELYAKVSLNNKYDVVYGAYNNGRAYIADLVSYS